MKTILLILIFIGVVAYADDKKKTASADALVTIVKIQDTAKLKPVVDTGFTKATITIGK